MIKIRHTAIVLAAGILLLYSCRSAKAPTAKGDKKDKEDFDAFYDRFLTDSTFQMSRIMFPLPGINAMEMEDSGDSTYYWTKDNWIMLKKPDIDPGEFVRKTEVTDTLATDEIYMDNAGFYFKTIYKPIKSKWHLVYMIDSNM